MPHCTRRPAPLLLTLLALGVLALVAWLGSGAWDAGEPVERSAVGPGPVASPRLEGAARTEAPAAPTDEVEVPTAGGPAADLAVAGTVRGTDGEPIHGGWVDVTAIPRNRSDPSRIRHECVQLDGEGRFRLEGLPPGRVRLAVQPARDTRGRRASTVVDAGDEHVEITVAMRPRRCRVPISVVDATAGTAPHDTRLAVFATPTGQQEELVLLRWLEPLTNPPASRYLGDYDAVPGSTVTFRVLAIGYEQREPIAVEIPVDAETHPVRLVVNARPDQVAHLTLHLVASGRATPQIVVGESRHPTLPVYLEHLVEDGRVALRMPEGRHVVTVESPHDANDAVSRRDVQVADLVVELKAGERREVTVPLVVGGFVFLVGEPDAWVPTFTFRGTAGSVIRTAFPSEHGDEGGHIIGPIAPGSWTLTYDGTDRLWRGEVEVRAGETTRIHRDDLEAIAETPIERE